MAKDPSKYIEWANRQTLDDIHSACVKTSRLAHCMIFTKDEREFVRVLREMREITNELHFDVLEVLLEIGATRVDPETEETYDVNDVVMKKQEEEDEDE